MAARVVAAAALAAVALLAPAADMASAANHDHPRHPWTQPHVLRYATAEDIVSLNPHLNSQVTLGFITQLQAAWLFRFDAHNRPVPELATVVPAKGNGGVSADGKTITIHLRRDAKWSDGVPFTAKDVAFTVRVVMNDANNESARGDFEQIDRVETADPYTVRLRLKQPWASFYVGFFGSAYAEPCVLPEHAFGGSTAINEAPYNALPVGIGPFKIAEWKRGDAVTLVRDPLYFGRKPKLERVVFKIITDRNTMLTQLRTHEIDMWALVPAGFADRARELPATTTIRQASFLFAHYDFNLAHPPLDDPVVRRALRLGMPRLQMLAKVRHGYGVLQESPFPPGHPYHVDFPAVTYDVRKANALLDAAGWKRGADGVREKNGRRLAFELASFTGSPDTDAEIELIRTAWQQIGVSFEVRRALSTVMFAPAAAGGIIRAGKFDITGFAWTVSPAGDLQNLYGCDRFPPKGQNDPHWCNRGADALMTRFNRTFDEGERRSLSRAIQRALYDDVPMVVTFAREDVYTFNDDLHDFHPNQATPFDDLVTADI